MRNIRKANILMAFALIAVVSPAFADEPSAKLAKEELQKLQGTWMVVYSEQHGERRRDLEEVKKMRLVIEGDQWTLDYHNNVKDQHVATMKLEPTHKPKAADLRFTKGLATGETLRSIYELRGNELKFCFPDELNRRPNNFNSSEGVAGRWLLVLKRVSTPEPIRSSTQKLSQQNWRNK